MGRVLTNFTTLEYTRQDGFGDIGTNEWKLLEPNGGITFGADVTTTPRNPISKNRQRRKGSVTDLDSEVAFEADLTFDSMIDFVEGYCFATAVNWDLTFIASDASTTLEEFTVPSITVEQAPKFEYTITTGPFTLLWATGYVGANNNGLHVLDAAVASTDVVITVAEDLTDETAAGNADLSVCGIRNITSDLTIGVVGTVGTLTSTAGIADWATLGLTVGQFIHIGGLTSSEQFTTCPPGFARITAINTNVLTLDKLSTGMVTDAGSGDTVDVLFGRFIRNVAVDSAEFLEQYFTFEASFTNLFETDPPTPVADPDGFEYAEDNLCNEWAITFDGQSLATCTFGFTGTDTEPPVDNSSRLSGADTPREPVFTGAINTAADFARLRIIDVDETGLTTDFSDINLTINNGVTPEKVLGVLGARFLNTGNFEVNLEANVIFTEPLVINRIRENTTVSFDLIMENDDGGFAIDIPALTLSGGGKDYAVNESVKIALTGEAFQDPILGTSIGISFFPVTPTSAA
ncbi:MAG: hypothetical protein DRJ50_02775 [Actinobacteria bacterium]|nr:MAG: hypothetical protein DRJ50_02775 [Actinomycetota bacterium]